jgi:hydroxyacylglutathione hydrolase
MLSSLPRLTPSGLTAVALLTATLALPAFGQIPQPNGGPVEAGSLPLSWQTGGPNCMTIPDWQIHEYNPTFYILRESGCTNYEKPFLYLIFGKTHVLLVDTGAGKAKTREIVEDVIARYRKRNGNVSLSLVIAHSHGHGDHIAGDFQFRDRPNTRLIEGKEEAVRTAFHIPSWPEGLGQIDLGDRIIDVVPLPGHQKAAVAYYDRRTGVVLSGDTFYPGRLFVADWPTYVQSIQRLVDFTQGKVVTHFLGCHIEQKRQPYAEYPIGSAYQPEEHDLSLGRGQLLELNAALKEIGAQPQRRAYADLTIFPVNDEVWKELDRVRAKAEAAAKQ